MQGSSGRGHWQSHCPLWEHGNAWVFCPEAYSCSFLRPCEVGPLRCQGHCVQRRSHACFPAELASCGTCFPLALVALSLLGPSCSNWLGRRSAEFPSFLVPGCPVRPPMRRAGLGKLSHYDGEGNALPVLEHVHILHQSPELPEAPRTSLHQGGVSSPMLSSLGGSAGCSRASISGLLQIGTGLWHWAHLAEHGDQSLWLS